jgi:hypothetical protein
MDKIVRIKQGFETLKEDCSRVLLAGFVNKSDIPENAKREDDLDTVFGHEYNNTKTDGWDDASFWGNIYLPFYDDVYLNFEVYA